jgi:hypothetical protein
MANQKTKKIGKRPEAKPVNKLDTLHETWTVMKSFVHFSAKALRVLAHGLIFIVKNVPKPDEHKSSAPKDGKVIKI